MGFVNPNLPDIDAEAWNALPRQDRMRPMARHYAEIGFGSPDLVYLVYLVKMLAYVGVGWALVMSTPGIDGAGDFSAWWGNPAVFFTFVLWTMLFEVLGLGCAFGPLNLRFVPPLGSFLYWLRPGTIRLAPWPNRVPLTGGDRRTVLDAVLYLALVVSLVWAMVGAITHTQVIVVLVVLALIGLRDKTIFLAARAEVYAPLAAASLLVGGDQVVAAKLLMVMIWWGAATSKLNRHFPFVVQAMMSNSPMWRFGRIKHAFHRRFPEDLRPSRLSAALAHGGTVVEFGVPLVLLLSGGGPVTTVAAIVMVLFHLNIISSFPMGVPLEWNIFMILGISTLFVEHADLGVGDLTHPWPVIGLLAVVLGTVVVGNLWPEKVSFLPSMRYYAGNWGSSLWCFGAGAVDRIDAAVSKASMLPHQQLAKVYGEEQTATELIHLGFAFRTFHPHGRALWSLVPRACPDHEDRLILDGETVAGTALGWNFGDGHLHHEQLGAALQSRCGFEPGQVRVVFLESQPFHRQVQHYRLFDLATGEIERGYVRVADLVDRQPTDNDVPVQVTDGTG